MAAYSAMRDELSAFDAWRSPGTQYQLPLLFVQGEHDTYSVTSDVERYAADVEAPSTRVALLPGGGHSAFMLGTALREILERELPR